MNRIRLFFLNRFALNAYISTHYTKAIKYYEKILRSNPDFPGLMHNIGLCCFAMKDYNRAESFLLEDIDSYGETDSRLRTMGDLYYRWGKREQALMYYKRLEEYLNHGEKWLKLRIAILKDEEESVNAFNAADRLDEALVKMREGLADDAKNLLEAGSSEDPSSFQILNNLGVIALKEYNDPEKAVFYFEQADDLMPLPMHKANLKKARSLL